MSSDRGTPRAGVARTWAGFASLGAGLLHAAVLRDHLEEYWLFGAFFAVVAAYQVGWGIATLARTRLPLPAFTVAFNLGVVGLWAVTRAVGLPVGPAPWQPEAIGATDVVSVGLELGVAALVVVAATRATAPVRRTLDRRSPAAHLGMLAAGALAVAAVTTPGLAAAQEHAHVPSHHGSTSESGEDAGHGHGDEAEGGTDKSVDEPAPPAPSDSPSRTETTPPAETGGDDDHDESGGHGH